MFIYYVISVSQTTSIDIHSTAAIAYNILSEKLTAIESRFEQEMKNIENQVIESKKRAEQKIANELKEEQEELYSRIEKHNLEVKRFNKDLGLRPLLKKLANVEVEIKALAQAEDYYEGKHQTA